MLGGLAIAGLLAVGLGASAPAAERLRPKVSVVDDVYLPDALTIPKDTKVRFRWSDANVNIHDVTLEEGPRKADPDDFRSEPRINDYRFSPRFKKRGTYRMICSIHPDTMNMVIKVKRATN